MNNTIHKRTHGGGVIIHRILLSHKDLHDCEGVKHDLEKYFLKLRSTGKIFLCYFKAFYHPKDGILLNKRQPFIVQ